MMSDVMRSDDDMSFVFGRASPPARLMVGLAAGTILCLATAATHVSSVIHVSMSPSSSSPSSSSPASLSPASSSKAPVPVVARREVVRIAYAQPRAVLAAPAPSPTLAPRRMASARLAAARGVRPGRHAGRATRARRPLSFALTRLDADGIIGESAPRAAQDAPAGKGVAAWPVAAGAVDFDSGLGRVTTAARAGTLNGQPAAALDIGLSDGGVRFNAAGMTDMASLADPATMRRAFKVCTGASIPLD